MVLAKVNIAGTTYSISSKTDISKLEKALTLNSIVESGIVKNLEQAIEAYTQDPVYFKERFGFNNLINKTYLLKDMMQLHPMLEKYNLMDYLFTQQLMYSTVGSHVAHPAKGKFNTLINSKAVSNGDNYKSSTGVDMQLGVKVENSEDFFTDASMITINDQQIVQIDLQAMQHEYDNSVWNIQTYYDDNSKSKTYPKEIFSSFEEFLTFSVEKEIARKNHRKHQGESQATYEARLDKFAFKALDYKKLSSDMTEEASRFYAQHKRNVSFTAAMDQFQLNQIEGIPLWYNIAIIDDIKEGLFTIDGKTNKAKPFDGATFVNPYIMYPELVLIKNNSYTFMMN